jgi:WD40 repeat protein
MWDGRAANLWADPESGLGPYHFVSQPVQLTYGPISFIWWSPGKDAKQIFALGETLHGELVVRDTESGEFRGYLNGISAGFVDFSRDGKWVTYVTYPEGTLWRSRMDGSERLQLTFPPMARIVNPKWSPDGRFIAFTEWKEPRSIYLVPADGGSPMLLLTGDCEPADPTWSPDGKSLLYGGQSILNGIEGGPPSEIRVLNLETKQSKTIPGSQHMFSPQWSPDGHYIAALSDGMTKVYLYSFNTALWKEVLLPAMPTPRNVSFPAWSRDSRYLYVLVKSDIYKFHVPDGRPELATTPIGFEVTCPIWRVGWFGLTPDDRIMVLRDRGTDELYALDLEYR